MHDEPVNSVTAIQYFAGLAMQAMVAREGLPETESVREEYALWSYRMAQAMISMEQQLHIKD